MLAATVMVVVHDRHVTAGGTAPHNAAGGTRARQMREQDPGDQCGTECVLGRADGMVV